jgi:hypothetical protein
MQSKALVFDRLITHNSTRTRLNQRRATDFSLKTTKFQLSGMEYRAHALEISKPVARVVLMDLI